MNLKPFLPATLFIVSAAAMAGDDASRSFMERLDIDHDGFISQSEAKSDPKLFDNFSAADRDHDGVLSKDEISAYRQSMRVAQRHTENKGDSGSGTNSHSPGPGEKPSEEPTQ